MAKYRIVGGTPDSSGVLELPDDARIIGALYHPLTGELNVVILQKVLPSETPGKTDKSVIHLPASAEKKTTKEG